MTIDQEKLIIELKIRADKSEKLAKIYKDDGANGTAEGLQGKVAAYREIIYDIEKGKFKKKEPVITNFNKM